MIRVEEGTIFKQQADTLTEKVRDVLPKSGVITCRVSEGENGVVSIQKRRVAGVERIAVTLIDTNVAYTGLGTFAHPIQRLHVVTAPVYGMGAREVIGFTDGPPDRFIDVGT